MFSITSRTPLLVLGMVLLLGTALFGVPALADSDRAGDLRCSLTADDYSIEEGDGVRLRWTSDDAEEGRISLSIGRIDEYDLNSGSEWVYPDEDTTYRATFENDDDTVECTVRIDVDEDDNSNDDDDDRNGDLRCTLRADDYSVEEGDSVRLRWTSDDAEEGRISPDIGDIDEDDLDSGNESVRVYDDTTFRATFEDEDGNTVRCSVEIEVDEDNNNNHDDDDYGPLSCTPSRQSVVVGQSALFTASGGTGTYTWASDNSVLSNTSARTFSVTPTQGGVTTVIVRSGNDQALCTLDVIGSTSYTPGFPNTGSGPSAFLTLLGALVLAGAVVVSLRVVAWIAHD